MTTLGDIIYEDATPTPVRLAGSTSAAKNFLTQTGNGTISAAPAWGTIAAADLPTGTTSAKGALQLDGTATDIIGDATTPGAGATGKPADAGHAHPRILWAPADHNLITWAYDPVNAASSTALATAGTLYCVKMHLPTAQNITNIIVALTTAGSSLTSGQCFAALYQGTGGSLLGTTADQSGTWAGTTGLKTMAISGGAVAAAAGDLIVVFWFNGTTGPTFARGSGNSLINAGLSGANSRFGTANTGVTTTAPATLGTISALSVSYWSALS
jgi:hypothetical protein